MAINREKLGSRIQHYRSKTKMTQEVFADMVGISREHLSLIERGKREPAVDVLVRIANALEVSTDDLLVDSLNHSSSTADTELHKLMLDCNQVEEEVLVELVKHMKPVLYRLGI